MTHPFIIICLALFSCAFHHKLHAETIPAIHKKIYPLAQGFLYMGGGWTAAFGETEEEGCTVGAAYGFPIAWEKPFMEPEYACYSTTSPGVRVQGTYCLFCSDGYYRDKYCGQPLTCPDDSWTFMIDSKSSKGICYRNDDYCWKNINHVSEEQLLAAIVYGEASVNADKKEMFAIASTTMNMVRAHTKLNKNFIKYDNIFEFFNSAIYHDYAKALKNGNTRFRAVMCSENRDERIDMAYQAAKNALNRGPDYSNGACWWDGFDLKTEGAMHYRYRSPQGFHFSLPEHNLFSIKEPPLITKKIRGKTYGYTYESTAAYGRSIFWKYSHKFMKASGSPQCA